MLYKHDDAERYRYQIEVIEDAVRHANELMCDHGYEAAWRDGAKDRSVNAECAISLKGHGTYAGMSGTFGQAVLWLTRKCIELTDSKLHAAIAEEG